MLLRLCAKVIPQRFLKLTAKKTRPKIDSSWSQNTA
ncbi:hypothetical protein ANCCAN_24395 [Ancylostoma caninum]|uniref:Uncharacterized protein n=1 Tax=Ancylostoma caninum TaxID=29170 RepID=A0A368FCN8_ANCCA|nr:hypothetical protein ANCCAN_24395 [Ancylostoma caninum]